MFRVLAFCALSLAVACTGDTGPLNSDRIEQRFGSYGVEILNADPTRRVSSLFSEEPGGRVCRTYAIVDFHLPVDIRLASEHGEVTAGDSIGQVFRRAGWKIRKTTEFIAEENARDVGHDLPALMRVAGDQPLATHRYRFEVIKGDVRIHYATITEVHHPDYLQLTALLALQN